jgi:hypothetical protein
LRERSNHHIPLSAVLNVSHAEPPASAFIPMVLARSL